MMEDRLDAALHGVLGCCCSLCGVYYEAQVLLVQVNILGSVQVYDF